MEVELHSFSESGSKSIPRITLFALSLAFPWKTSATYQNMQTLSHVVGHTP